jgi:hypothetical protein
MEGKALNVREQFKSPEEELDFLREQVALRERQLEESIPDRAPEKNKEQAVKEVVDSYKEESHDVLHEDLRQDKEEAEAVSLKLKPEAHDRQMEELFGILLEKGLKNTLAIVEQMSNPHIEDDFHRFLVQYLAAAHNVPGLKENTPMYKSLNLRLYEVTLPAAGDKEEDFKAVLGAMHQFYAGMQSVAADNMNKSQSYYTIEIAQTTGGRDVVIYAAVPEDKFHLFEKQVLAFYQKAKITEVPDDYNIFSERGVVVASHAKLRALEAYPIRTYDEMDHDPMNAIVNTFSKLSKEEGAAIQIIISPTGNKFIERFSNALDKVKKGEKPKDALSGGLGKAFAKVGKEFIFGANSSGDEGVKDVDDRAVEMITKKTKSTIVSVSVRIIASAATEDRVEDIVEGLESSFNQFDLAGGNSFEFVRAPIKRVKDFVRMYSFRLPSDEQSMPLNLDELSTIFHFPVGVTSSPDLKEAKAGIAPAPRTEPTGILLGMNNYRGEENPVYYAKEDRVRHLYAVGQTGAGKSSLLKNMAIQDIERGDGVCFIDPHGSDIEEILACVPENRVNDVIYFDPAHYDRPMGLNMLEYDPNFPQQKTFVVDEMLSIFNKLFDMKTAGGPMFEQYFRNATLLVLEDPGTGSTLLDISRVLADENFRKQKLARCGNPVVKQFWEEVAGKAGGEASLQNIVPYITSKFDVFLANEFMRPIVAQQDSAFRMRDVMDNKKILLVNLSKGRLGEINSNLIGLIIVGKILMAALSRVDSLGGEINDFYLYIDEFQNVTTDSISQILSEARKYRLSLNVAHQYISQIDENIKNAVFGNVGSMAIFRVSVEDAEFLEQNLLPVFTKEDIIRQDNFNAYVKMLVGGVPAKPFNIALMYYPDRGDRDRAQKIKELSFLTYGRPREEIEYEIMNRYKKPEPPKPLEQRPSV